MIKEHDQQAKTKAMPRRLAYADSDKEASVRQQARGFSDRFSLKSSGTSDTYRQTRSANKSQRTPSKNIELAYLRRSRRLEDRSITKKKARRENSKSSGKRSRYQETSSDSKHEEGSEDTYEDLNSPYKRPKPTPFTQRITRFRYNRRAKLPRKQGSRGSFRTESKILGRILAIKEIRQRPYLQKNLNKKIPKIIDEMFERVRAFIRGEVAAGSAEMVRPSQGDKGNAYPVWSGVQERARNRNGPKDTRRNMGMYTLYPRRDTFTPLTKNPKEILAMENISFPEPPPLIGTLESRI
ncbi:hypothetical protein Tco_0190993 [Tanacetum coccineum]